MIARHARDFMTEIEGAVQIPHHLEDSDCRLLRNEKTDS